jgi:two-component system phosphate regulon response regulator OmpR
MYPAGQRILIIDDDARRRAVSERVLSEAGFAVTTVSEGFSAIRAAGSHRVALAIAAVELPGVLDGRSTVRQIRTRQPWLKALFTGAAAGQQWRRNGDCDDFISSPFDQRDLLGCVFELLQRDTGGAHAGRNRAG